MTCKKPGTGRLSLNPHVDPLPQDLPPLPPVPTHTQAMVWEAWGDGGSPIPGEKHTQNVKIYS